MQIVGNFFLLLAMLALGCLFFMTFLQKPAGGDASIGHAYATMYVGIAFAVCFVLVACILYFGGGFAWLSLGRFGSGPMLLLYFLVMGFGLFGLDKPAFRSIPFLVPSIAVATLVVLMITFAVLLNDTLKAITSPTLLKSGLAIVLALNGLVLLINIFGGFASSLLGKVTGSSDQLSDFELGILAKIDTTDVSKGINSLFIYSGNNQPQEIRDKARLKIKSKPDWQDELYQTLEGDGVEEAFRFLLDNEVDDKARFAKGVNQGLLSQARVIRARLNNCWHPDHVTDGMFGSELRRTLKVMEKYKDQGVDYKAGVQEMRAALDERKGYGDPNHSDKKLLDKWLGRH